MKHASDFGSDGVSDIVEGAVMPLRVTWVSTEGLWSGVGLSEEESDGDCEEVDCEK